MEIALDMQEYASQMRHELTRNLIIKCASCGKKLIVYPTTDRFSWDNIFDHYIYHKARPFLQPYDNYFMCQHLTYCPYAKQMSCSICGYEIEYEYTNIDRLIKPNPKRIEIEEKKLIITHLTDHSTQVKKIAITLLADKNSPFHMFDEYVMKNILVHCASKIKPKDNFY
jgi:hypothetical protein